MPPSDRPALRRAAPALPPEHAARAHLRFIRDTMQRSAAFTAVPGWGGVLMGVTAVAAAFLAAEQTTAQAWLRVWGGEAVVGATIGVWATLLKARQSGAPVLSGAGRKFLLGLAPAIAAGAAATAALYAFDAITLDALLGARPLSAHVSWRLLPGLWMLCYGAGVVSGGMFSIRLVPMMGLGLMGVGLIALVAPAVWGDALLGLGLGGLHIGFGLAIARKHGG